MCGILTRGNGEADCGMSAAGLEVLAREGVAKSTSLAELDLSGKSACDSV